MKFWSSTRSSRHRAVLKWSFFVAMLVVALVVDLLTKRLAVERLSLGETREVLPFLSLQRTANDGAAFGLLGGKSAWIIALNLIALVVLMLYVFFEHRPLLGGIAGGAVVGGSLGNMVERLSGDGQVTDFLKFPHWPNFNAADVFIDAGLAAVVIGLVVELVIAWRTKRQNPASS
ncbi:MAG: signal peptidase II [Actinobacteria bacterium RBG_13_63_9]|nr:MAG: signal peptidase II [Actinobacteria bacterium RBG_13_63_9]